LKIATRKTKISSQLHNVWSEFRADPGMGWAPLRELQGQGGLVFNSSGKTYLHVIQLYKFSVWKCQRRYCPEEIGESWRTGMIMGT
jgi:hypothetical protein